MSGEAFGSYGGRIYGVAGAPVPVQQEGAGVGVSTSEGEDTRDARSALLHDASEIVTSDRNKEYGEPEDNFRRIAALWSTYLECDVQSHDVAAMMNLLKIARIMHNPSKRDSWLDAAGYLACGWASVTR